MSAPGVETAGPPLPEPPFAHLTRADLYRRVAVGLAVLIFLGVSLYFLKAALTPIIAAFILAYFLDPVIDWGQARGIPRSAAIVLLLAIVLGILTLCAIFVVPRVAVEFGKLLEKMVVFVQQVANWAQTRFGLTLPHTLQETIDSFGADIKRLAPDAAGPLGVIAGAALSGTMNVLTTIFGLIFVPVFAFYFLRDFDAITGNVYTLVPFAYRPWVRSTFREIDETLANFIRGQLTVAAVKAVLYAVLLSFAGVKLSVVIGVIAGFGSIVPYLGGVLGASLTALMVAVDYTGPGQVLFVVLIFAGVEAADGLFITPLLLGDRVGLSPVAVIVALLVGGEVLGFAGVLLAVPAAAVIRILVRRAMEAYRGTSFFAGSTEREVVIHDPAEIDEFTRQARCACGGFFKIEERGPEGATLVCARGGELRKLIVVPVPGPGAGYPTPPLLPPPDAVAAAAAADPIVAAAAAADTTAGSGEDEPPPRPPEPLPEPDAKSVARVVRTRPDPEPSSREGKEPE